MKCSGLHKKLIFYAEGSLSENEMAQIRSHLMECHECESFLKELKLTLGIMEMEKTMESNPFFYTRVNAKLENGSMETIKTGWNAALVRILQPTIFSLLLLSGVYGGIKIGQPSGYSGREKTLSEQELLPLLNEMNAEPIESFLME
jgi:hypothetical protein